MEGFGAAVAPPAQPAQMAQGQGEPASPEEQAMYDKFVSMALLHMHDPKVAPKLAEQIRGGDPVKKIGQIGATLAMTLLQKARKAGEEIPPDVILHGGVQIIDALVEIGEAAGVGDITEEQATQAFEVAADRFRDMVGAGGGIEEQAAPVPPSAPVQTPAGVAR